MQQFLSAGELKQRLVIHIGMHTIGATSIQRYLSRNRFLLRRLGVEYPESFGADGRRHPNHAALFDAISHEADFGRPHLQLGSASAMVEALSRRIEASERPLSILSAEGPSGPMRVFAGTLAPLADRFAVSIAVFLRRTDLWAESFHRQMVMSRAVREARPSRAFLTTEEMRRHLDFSALVGCWADVFGSAALRLRAFTPERSAAAPMEAFLEAAGAPPLCRALPHRCAHPNASPSAQLAAAVRRANAPGLFLTREEAIRLDPGPAESDDAPFSDGESRTVLAIHRQASQLAKILLK